MQVVLWIFVVIAGLYLIGVLTCLFATRDNAAVDKAKCFSPLSWLSYVSGNLIMYLCPPHVLEQFMLRFFDKECRQCVSDGKCFDCGCDMPAKAYVPYEKCSRGNWGPIIWDKEEYQELRELYPIKIEIKYDNEGI